ncbi:MAG: hypothetical protein ABIO99_02790, partial [Candidatus Limnocylindria bacterium]
ELETIALPSRSNARDATNGMGSAPPFRAEIERRDPAALERAACRGRRGHPLDGLDATITAHLVISIR